MEVLFDDDCFAIRQAARFASQLYDRHLARVGLTITQFSVLVRLNQGGPMTMKQLAETMRMQRTTLVRTVQPLRRAKLVSSNAASPDARTLWLAITQEGATRLAAARRHWDDAQAEFEQRFGAQRSAALRSELFALTRHSVEPGPR